MKTFGYAAAALAMSLAAAPAFAQDGAQLFNMQCKMCHGPASTVMAPALAGVAGAKIAARQDFAYSPALKAKDGAWTDANLDAFLKAPMAFAPGTRMPVSVPDDANRAAIVAYLHTLK
ncbi:c-type cytochrome [Phenylobacterium soli]|uniref:Cytochrome c family protein n=1 Tax=Phenylobacterium soli TaxID=2170551 RepID=A0A328AK64_9CAUL|nr:c-type cytochrome [Phenylobacterium soli]RAK53268.1 cytochrome c family protein [Phenylobacterium soli]